MHPNMFLKILAVWCTLYLHHAQKTKPLLYSFPVQYVDHCPISKQEWVTAAETMNCTKDEKGRFTYLCLPNHNRSALVQFCKNEKTGGLYLKRHCVYLTENGNIQQNDCSAFISGCPENHYYLHEINKYKDCLRIDQVHMCYKAHPSCKNIQRQNQENVTESPKNETKIRISSFILSERKESERDNSPKLSLTLGLLIPFVVAGILTITIICIYAKQKKTKLMDPEIIPLIPNQDHWDVSLYQFGNSLELFIETKLLDINQKDYIWTKDENTISKDETNKYHFEMKKGGNPALFIFDVNENDKGKYLFRTADGDGKSKEINLDIRPLEIVGIPRLPEFEKHDPDHIRRKIIETCVLHKTKPNDSEPVTFSVVILRMDSGQQEDSSFKPIGDEDIYLIGLQSILYPNDASSISLNTSDSEEDQFASSKDGLQSKHSMIPINSIQPEKLIGRKEKNNDALKKAKESHLFNILSFKDNYLSVEFRSDEIKFNFLCEVLFKCVTTIVLREILRSLPIRFVQEYFSVYGISQEGDTKKFLLPPGECAYLIHILLKEHFRQQEETRLHLLKEILFLGPYDDTKDFWYKYVRTRKYVPMNGENIIRVSTEEYDTFVDTLGVGILIHPSIEDKDLHEIVHKKLKVPMEIIRWDLQQRKGYFEKYRDKILVKRARLMIVGCAAAGKTTLVERLKNPFREPKDVQPTVGIDIQNDVFEINENEYDFQMCSQNTAPTSLLSIADFAGQTAYYACHQIYLTRRALYVLVIDMTKNFEDKIDDRFNSVSGTMFENWKNKDFLVFWLRSISTYCEETTPVILVATHGDKCVKKEKSFFKEICDALPKEENLNKHLSEDLYFELAAYPDSGKEIKNLKKCIVNEVVKQSTWREYIPKHWKAFEDSINEQRSRGINFVETNTLVSPEIHDLYDILQFYHEIGEILFLNEKSLKDIAILNAAWFSKIVCAILREPKHTYALDQPQSLRTFEFETPLEKELFEKKGLLQLPVLERYLKKYGHAPCLLQYMQRLGLMAILKNVYIPCMNIDSPKPVHFKKISEAYHTSVLIYKFENFHPHFYFYRLIVACMQNWTFLEHSYIPLLFQNAAFFQSSRSKHIVVLGCDDTFIQLQVYTRLKLRKKVTLEIRSKVEDIMKTITKTFHRSQRYSVGYLCRGGCIGENTHDSLFISEADVIKRKRSGELEEECPKHAEERQIVYYKEMLKYWVKTSTSVAGACYASPT